jgi:hypothetical protein
VHEAFSAFIAPAISAVNRERHMPTQTAEWPYKKLVVVALLCIGYTGAAAALLYPFYMYTLD